MVSPDSLRTGAAKAGIVGAYDVLAYLVPGSILVAAVGGFEAWARLVLPDFQELHTPLFSSITNVLSLAVSTSGPSGTGAAPSHPVGPVMQLALLFVGLAAIYLIGHTVASVSALSIDRIYVKNAHGYPFQRLLLGKFPTGWKPDFYRALFLYINVYFVLRYLGGDWSLFPASPRVEREPFKFLHPDFGAFVIGIVLIVLFAAKWLFSNHHVRRFLSSPERESTLVLRDRLFEWLAAPARFVTIGLGRFIGARRRFTNSEVESFKAALKEGTGVPFSLEDSSAYWNAVIHVRRSCPELSPAVEGWLLLYSFCRNAATALYLSFLYCFVWMLTHSGSVGALEQKEHSVLLALPLAFLVAAFAMLLRYFYLYHDYYSAYLIRAVAAGVKEQVHEE